MFRHSLLHARLSMVPLQWYASMKQTAVLCHLLTPEANTEGKTNLHLAAFLFITMPTCVFEHTKLRVAVCVCV